MKKSTAIAMFVLAVVLAFFAGQKWAENHDINSIAVVDVEERSDDFVVSIDWSYGQQTDNGKFVDSNVHEYTYVK